MNIEIKEIKITNGPYPDAVYEFDKPGTQQLLSAMFRMGFMPKVTLLKIVIPEKITQLLDDK